MYFFSYQRYVLLLLYSPSYKKLDKIVVVGSNSLNGNSSTKKAYSVKETFPHKGFNVQSLHDDIGLIQLNNKIEFNEKVKRINLPVENYLAKANYEAVLTGWGYLKVIIDIF